MTSTASAAGSRRRFLTNLCGTIGASFVGARLSAAQSVAPAVAIPATASIADELWLLDTSTAGCELNRSTAYRLSGGCWERVVNVPIDELWKSLGARPSTTSIDTMSADATNVRHVVYDHGNRATFDSRLRDLRALYRALRCRVPTGQTLRIVAWGWPSGQIRGPIRDAKQKLLVADGRAGMFAETLQRLAPNVPTSVVGYSYGARIALGALTKLASEPEAVVPPLRLAMFAAALAAWDVASCGRYAAGLRRVDHAFSVVNHRDPALRFYAPVDGRRGAEALGRVGFRCGCAESGKCSQLDATQAIGDDHSFLKFVGADDVMRRVAGQILWNA